MKKMMLTLVAVFCLNVFLPAAESIAVTAPQTEQAPATAPVQVLTENADDYMSIESEDAAKKRRKKKKKKNPVVKYIIAGAVAAAAIVIYVATNGEGYHSR